MRIRQFGFTLLFFLPFSLCSLPPFASPLLAQCTVSGTSDAEPADMPELGLWKYSITVSWDTGSPYGLSHLDVILGLGLCPCVCDGFSFATRDTTGFSTGTTDGDTCTMYYRAAFYCDGDPSVPTVEEPLVKFEPFENGCEPGSMGTGTFWFYSDWAPVAVASPDSMLVIKFDMLPPCFGDLVGELPRCTAPSAARSESWGRVKILFR